MTSFIIFGSINWGIMGWIVLGTLLFTVVVAAVGRGIAVVFPPKPEHMSSFKKPAIVPVATSSTGTVNVPVARALPTDISPEIMAVIAASVATVLSGQKFSVRGVRPANAKTPNIEHLMAEWSMEGRRQVYFSHNPRQ